MAQVQNKTINLTFNHPVKALFWTGMADNTQLAHSDKGVASYTALLQLNGHDRFSRQDNMYFTGVQPYECGLRTYKCCRTHSYCFICWYVFILLKTWRTSTIWFMQFLEN